MYLASAGTCERHHQRQNPKVLQLSLNISPDSSPGVAETK